MNPLTQCQECGSLLMLTRTGAVCSRDVNCGRLHTSIDRAAIIAEWDRQRDLERALRFPRANQCGRDKQLEPLYMLEGVTGQFHRAINLCRINSGTVQRMLASMPSGSIVGRLEINGADWVCIFTADDHDPARRDVPLDLFTRVDSIYQEAKQREQWVDLS